MILGIYGHHKSGKTRLLELLIPRLNEKGVSAAAIKHLGHGFGDEVPGDTGRLSRAGYSPVIGISEVSARMHVRGEIGLQKAVSTISEISEPDVILVEGFKSAPLEKIAVGDIEELPGTVMHIHGDQDKDIDDVADYILRRVSEERRTRGSSGKHTEKRSVGSGIEGDTLTDLNIEIMVNGKRVPTNEFVESMFWHTLIGMISSLKGVDEEIKKIEISASKE